MINKVNLCGHVGQDPTIKQVGDTKVAQFSLATSKSWKDKKTGEKKKETQWHNIVVWGAQAEVCEKYVRKGNLIQVFGELNYRSYEDKEGIKRNVTDIRVQELFLMPSGTKGEQVPPPPVPDDIPRQEGDDLPF